MGKDTEREALTGVVDGMFSHIAVWIMLFTLMIMGAVFSLLLLAEILGQSDVLIKGPGKVPFQVDSAGIFIVKAPDPGSTGLECVLSRGGRQIPMSQPGKAWYSLLSSKPPVHYVVHLDIEGTYEIDCREGDLDLFPEPVVAQRGLYENGIWLFGWMVILPSLIMAGALLVGFVMMRGAIPRGP